MADCEVLTLEQIRVLTGHGSNDAVRMALKRAGVRSQGVAVSMSWPPKKIYGATDVWNTFSTRMLRHARTDRDAAERLWEAYGDLIKSAVSVAEAKGLFAQKLEESE